MVVVRDLTLMMMYMSSSCPDLPKMTLIIDLHLSSINFTLFALALKRSTSQNPNPEISVKLLYLFVEFTTIVKLIIPMEVNKDTPIFLSWHNPPPPPPPPPNQKILYPPLVDILTFPPLGGGKISLLSSQS